MSVSGVVFDVQAVSFQCPQPQPFFPMCMPVVIHPFKEEGLVAFCQFALNRDIKKPKKKIVI